MIPGLLVAAATHLSIDAGPVFGPEAASGDGWAEIVARVDNAGSTAEKGTLEVTTAHPTFYYSAEQKFVAQAPFRVEGHASALIHVPVPVGRYMPTVTVTATDASGAKTAETSVSFAASTSPLLVDVSHPSRLSVVMRGWPMAPTWNPGHAYGSSSSTALTMGVPSVDPTTGDVLLPERTAAYAATTLVVIPSDALAHLHGPPLDALVGWVLSGGTLAVVPMRPEDLRTGILPTLVGGPIGTTAPPPAMLMLPSVKRGAAPPSLAPAPAPTAPWAVPPMPSAPETPEDEEEDEDDAGAGAGATPIGYWIPARSTPLAPTTGVGPSAVLRSKLVGYTGGNLRPSAFGATAAYGLGQVHVLAFDPMRPPALEDGWSHARILEMLSDAWDRHALTVFPPGAGSERASNTYEVHRALDPNENFRAALGFAAILLVLYSIVSGPLVFLRARKRGRPLDPLVWAPVASATCFASVVLVGLAGKGWSGRARHLSLVEAGAGMTRGTVHRFRGFFSSQTRTMRVRASEEGSVLEVLSTDSQDTGQSVLRLDKDGLSLENLTSLPWQTVVVSEDGATQLGNGIAVRQKSDGSVVVANHTGHTLRNVVVWAPQTDASWFASIDDGTTILSTAGRTLFVPSAREERTAGTRTVHPWESARLRTVLAGKDADDMAPWNALVAGGGPSVDFWPDDVPVVIGEIVGGEGATNDAGLRIESDRLFFRVVGEGGAT
ncbi:MAG TPA: hypothetical protein VF765_30290 [Polyangiaceae bacterium]